MSALALLVLLGPAGSAAPAAVSDDASEALMRQATAAYDRDDFPGALAALQGAYAISPRVDILFNVGQVQRALHDCAAARASYQRFLAEAAPGDPNRSRAERRAAEMQTCLDQNAPPVPPPAAREPMEPGPPIVEGTGAAARPFEIVAASTHPKHARLRVLAWSLLAASAVAAAACAYLAWRASGDSDFSHVEYGSSQYRAQWRDGPREQSGARWTGAAAIAAGVGGATLILVSRPEPRPAAGMPVGWSVGWSWRF